MPYIKFFQNTVRRKPFLIQNLENTMIKLIMSMDFFDADTRKKVAIGTSTCGGCGNTRAMGIAAFISLMHTARHIITATTAQPCRAPLPSRLVSSPTGFW